MSDAVIHATTARGGQLAGLDQAEFDDFRCGRLELPAASFERGARRLWFSLVRSAQPVGA